MKFFLLAILLASSSSMYAQYIASAYSEGTVTYIAESGTVIMKGDPLYKLCELRIKVQRDIEKLQLHDAEADLKDKLSDLKRADRLKSKEAISIAEHENFVVEYYISLIKVEKLKLDINVSKLDLSSYVTTAPYDCRVVRQLICVNSGTDIGTYILEIEPVNSRESKIDNQKAEGVLSLTAALNGQVISYLPEEGQIVKKGDVLLKYYSGIQKLQLKSLELALKEAKKCLVDCKSDFERTKKLYNNKIISLKEYENISLVYTKGSDHVKILENRIKDKKLVIKKFTVTAPYDVKITKLILAVESGAKVGKPILELKRL
jgi:multidrug resistance efflux pump